VVPDDVGGAEGDRARAQAREHRAERPGGRRREDGAQHSLELGLDRGVVGIHAGSRVERATPRTLGHRNGGAVPVIAADEVEDVTEEDEVNLAGASA
jgi:hypothetical protein